MRTTIDMGLQQAAEEAVEIGCANMARTYRVKQGAMVMIENGGAVRAMVGGRDYGENQFNRATKALRQPGSSFKVYTYSLAMENGLTPEIRRSPTRRSAGATGARSNYGNRYAGRIDTRRPRSRNRSTPCRCGSPRKNLGNQPIEQMAEATFGVETPLRNDVTIPLGTSEVTVLDQATAYAVFPAGGINRAGTASTRSSITAATCSTISTATSRRPSGC